MGVAQLAKNNPQSPCRRDADTAQSEWLLSHQRQGGALAPYKPGGSVSSYCAQPPPSICLPNKELSSELLDEESRPVATKPACCCARQRIEDEEVSSTTRISIRRASNGRPHLSITCASCK
mmetsp:Transcript_5738/g.17667  ORF Transcript_5738/g.17667 Transcript_5738/m.17667 type:complete len:121 (+) Transcript_5738:132-494(+)